jgi:hypothetical protein
MGFWNKLGKIALQAAPYVAAPFTGGASLMATGATQKLGQKWAEHDAKDAISKGLAPSKFDKYLGMASAGAGLGSMAFGGALSGLGKAGAVSSGVGKGAQLSSIASKAVPTASKLGNVAKIASAAVGKGNIGGWQGAVGKLAGNAIGSKVLGAPLSDATSQPGWEAQLGSLLSRATSGDLEGNQGSVTGGSNTGVASNTSAPSNDMRAAGSVNGFPINAGQARPRNLSMIDQGRNAALMSQPWRVGYDVRAQGPDDAQGNPQVITSHNPAIYPNYNPPVQAPPINESGGNTGSIFGNQLTPQYGPTRKRNPPPLTEEEAY